VSIQTRQKLHSPARATIYVGGRLDAAAAPALKDQLQKLVRGGYKELIVSLDGLDFMDSSGLGELVRGLSLAREAGGTLKLAALSEQAWSVVRLARLDRTFEIHSNAEAALASFS
jgi:anti-sigma B factor antagonist